MQIREYQCKCGSTDFFLSRHISQVGIYCSRCGRWLKWANKDEKNLELNQSNVIDNIEAEIANMAKLYIANENYVDINEVLNVINKYKESEE